MMLRLINTCLILAFSGSVMAHTLHGDAGTVAQLFHQVLGSHHFPLLLVLLAVGLLVLRGIRAAKNR
jgi:hypothetical protein